jgi:hypothetical protein
MYNKSSITNRFKGGVFLTIRNVIRRVNRGIVLAVLLVLGLIGYLVYDNARFNNTEKDAIKNMLEEYASVAGDLNILPDQERVPGKKPSEEAVKKKLEENRAVLEKYLTTLKEYESQYNDAVRSLETIFKENAESCAYVTDCEFTVTSVKNLKKNGPRHALADIDIKVNMKTIGKPGFFTMTGEQSTSGDRFYVYHEKGEFESEPETENEIDTKTYTYSWEYSLYRAQLEKTDGRWKIASAYSSSYSMGKLVEE